jgi:hypothetical protein
MKSAKVKKDLIEELKKKPVIEASCAKVGVGRTAFYDWKKKDPKFAKAVEMALDFGRDFVSDIAEMQLLNAIKAGDFRAVSLWLKTHKDEYRNRIEVEGAMSVIEELSPEKRALVERSLALANLTSRK